MLKLSNAEIPLAIKIYPKFTFRLVMRPNQGGLELEVFSEEH
jgi:hypothetical protein